MKSTVCEISCWRRKYIFFFLMMISALHSVTVFAQKRTISGTVVDERNEPLIGATIVAEGKSGMTITNVDGKFTLAVPDKAKTIEVSYLGYASQTISIKGKSVFAIRMSENDVQMDYQTRWIKPLRQEQQMGYIPFCRPGMACKRRKFPA